MNQLSYKRKGGKEIIAELKGHWKDDMAKRKVKIFRDLKTSLEGALRYEQGQPVDLRVAEVPDPPKRLKASCSGLKSTT